MPWMIKYHLDKHYDASGGFIVAHDLQDLPWYYGNGRTKPIGGTPCNLCV